MGSATKFSANHSFCVLVDDAAMINRQFSVEDAAVLFNAHEPPGISLGNQICSESTVIVGWKSYGHFLLPINLPDSIK